MARLVENFFVIYIARIKIVINISVLVRRVVYKPPVYRLVVLPDYPGTREYLLECCSWCHYSSQVVNQLI
jgi:hypothetical protein